MGLEDIPNVMHTEGAIVNGQAGEHTTPVTNLHYEKIHALLSDPQSEAKLKTGTDQGNDPACMLNNKLTVNISRPVYTQEEFDQINESHNKETKSIADTFRSCGSRFKCSGDCVGRTIVNHLPFIRVLRNYNIKHDLLNDFVSGLTVGIMHIPQGMAYGLLTTLPPIYGMYVSFFPVIIYSLLGTSHHISIGTFALISLMVASALDKFDCSSEGGYAGNKTSLGDMTWDGNETIDGAYNVTDSSGSMLGSNDEVMCKVKVATALALMTGLIQIGMSVCRLGFITNYLSDPLTRGLTTGASLHVFTSQIRHVFGISVNSYQGPLKLIYTYIDLFRKITETNIAAFIMAVICILILALIKELANPKVKKAIKMPIPVELIVVILGTMTSYLWNMEDRFDLGVVGDIPTGIPPPAFPPPRHFSVVAVDAVAIALVAFAINVSMAKLFAKKHNYEIDANQELLAYGACNVVSSMFNCYTSSASMSRSSVQEGVGGKTQVAGLVSCVLILLVLFAIGPLFEQLPKCVLAAIIIVNLKGLFLQFNDLKHLWKISIYDFLTWLVVCVAVVLIDIDLGLAIGVGFALLTVVLRTQRPSSNLLGQMSSSDMYDNKDTYSAAIEVPRVRMFRFESPLCFANAEHFVQQLFKMTQVNPRELIAERDQQDKKPAEKKTSSHCCCTMKAKSHQKVDKHVVDFVRPTVTDLIIDCSMMGFIDSMGADTLIQVFEEYKKAGIIVSLVGCSVNVRNTLEAVGFYDHVPKERLFVSMHDAVLVALGNDTEIHEKLYHVTVPSSTRM